MTETKLKRSLGFPLLTFYGLGSIVGAGIYVLIGEVALVAGNGMAMAFLVAGVIAGLSGATYAELSSRLPRSAGAAMFVDVAFKRAWLTRLVAVMLLFTGVVSSATICQGFVGYFQLFVPMPRPLIIVGLCTAMCVIACWGIKESAWFIAVITVLEVGGLFVVIFVASAGMSTGNVASLFDFSMGYYAIAAGAFLAFYAFIGFEDMANVAEEVKEPLTAMPRAILAAVVLSVILYFLLAMVAALFTDLTRIAGHSSPLSEMVRGSPWAMKLITGISLFAIVNGALVQIIMCARILYGMADRGHLPRTFAAISPRTNTPVFNTILITALILVMALTLSLVTLASITSTLMLTIFAMVNMSLIRIRLAPKDDHPGFRVPILVPWLGLASSLGLLFIRLVSPG